MGWFKRNLFVILVVSVALLAVAALVLEPMLSPRPVQEPLATQPTATRQEITGGEFQNNASEVKEPVESWPEYAGKQFNRYDLTLALDPNGKTLSGKLDFTYVNTENQPMDRLHFLLYPNSFEKESYGVFEQDDYDSAYPNGFSPGSIQILSVTSPDGKVQQLVTGEQNQVLEVLLVRPVQPGETARLTIQYHVVVPNCLGRFGYGDDTMSLVNCHPILSVFDDGSWHDYPYYNMGDPFYSETADYHASITAPAGWTIAATGELTRREEGDNDVWTVEAPGRRDFGFVASDRFDVMQQMAGDVLVRSYYLKEHKGYGRQALDCAVESVELYESVFGEYPYGEFAVVEADFFIGGMEYPGMVLIDQSLYTFGQNVVLDLVVSHETAHQWWYSTVGNDEVAEPWLDEGLTEFTTQYFFEKERDSNYNEFYQYQIDYFADKRAGQEGQYTVTLPASSFDDGLTYSSWVYDRAAQILHELRADVGDEAFFAGLRRYYEEHRLGVATRADLEEALEGVTGRELTQWLEQRFSQTTHNNTKETEE